MNIHIKTLSEKIYMYVCMYVYSVEEDEEELYWSHSREIYIITGAKKLEKKCTMQEDQELY